jgi:hypothetical protein
MDPDASCSQAPLPIPPFALDLLDLADDPQGLPAWPETLPAGWCKALAAAVPWALRATGESTGAVALSRWGPSGGYLWLGQTGFPLVHRYVRLSSDTAIASQLGPLSKTLVVVTLTGSLDVVMSPQEDRGQLTYAHHFEPGNVFACYAGARFRLRSTTDAFQLMLSRATLEADRRARVEEYVSGATRVCEVLDMLRHRSLASGSGGDS